MEDDIRTPLNDKGSLDRYVARAVLRRDVYGLAARGLELWTERPLEMIADFYQFDVLSNRFAPARLNDAGQTLNLAAVAHSAAQLDPSCSRGICLRALADHISHGDNGSDG